MNKEIELQFCFKGSRNYVQGADIFNAAIKNILPDFDEIKNIKYAAYNMLHQNATMYVVDKLIKGDYDTINSTISFVSNGKKYYAVVCQNNKAIECSVDYSEDEVKKKSKITNNVIVFKNVLTDTYTEIVISMNKHFLNNTVKEKGKWIVTKFDYENLTDISNVTDREVKIELLQNFNNKLTKSSLYLDDKKVGNLFFSLV